MINLKPCGKKIKKFTLSIIIQRILIYIFLVCVCIMCLFSFYMLIINTTRSHASILKGFSFFPGKRFMTNFKNVLDDNNFPVLRGVLNSLFVSVSVATCVTYFSALTAYGVYAYNFRLKKKVRSFILMIMMLPTQVSALGFVRLMGTFHLTETYVPLIIPAIASPFAFYFLMQYMQSALNTDIVEAARVDGSGEFRTFNQIVLPILKPALAVQGIFAFVGSWNNYFMPALILTKNENKTVPILIAQLRSADYMNFDMGKVYALIAVGIIPVVIAYLFLSKFIIRGVAAGSIKG